MNDKVLTIQDISCVGQCSLTVALPIISACGIETAILPSAVLSTHTAGFKGFTFRDLTDDIPDIAKHWKNENISFKAIYTGYLGSARQTDMVKDIINTLLSDGGVSVVDPAMADNGKLYPAFDDNYVTAMKSLCAIADYVVPNVTEAAYLTDSEYKETYDRTYIDALTQKLFDLGAKNVILTGVSFDAETTGVIVADSNKTEYYKHVKLPQSCHGTGDIYASAFVGSLMNGKSAYDSAQIAADFVVNCIKATPKAHWYGACFEPVLKNLIEMMK